MTATLVRCARRVLPADSKLTRNILVLPVAVPILWDRHRALRRLGDALLTPTILAAAICAWATEHERSVLTIAGSWSGLPSQTEVAAQFTRERKLETSVVGLNNRRGFEFLKSGQVDVLMYTPEAALSVDEAVAKAFPEPASRPTRYEFGQFVVHVLVHPGNSTRRMTFAQLRQAFAGQVANWRQEGAGGRKIELAVEHHREKSFEIVKKRILGEETFFSPNCHVFKTSDEVAAFVAKTPGALGFCLHRHQPMKGVRSLDIAQDEDGPYYAPTDENVLAKNYPLTEELLLFTRPGGRPEADRYCQFACSAGSAETAKKFCLFPAAQRAEYLAAARLADYKAGKGAPVAVCGLAGREDVVKALAVGYVKAKALVQVKYDGRATAEEAERAFGEKGEVLVEEGVVSGQLSVVRGQLSVAGGAKQLTTDHGPRTTYPLGHRAVGVIVHRDSAVKELTLDDLRGIYSGEIDAWPGASGKDAKMRLYGLAGETVTMKVLAEVVRGPLSVVGGDALTPGPSPASGRGETAPRSTPDAPRSTPSGRHARITRRDDTAKVVQAVAGEPGALGFVDLAAMPAKESSVKLLAILADGAKRTAAPSADAVPDGYPLAQPVTLHVHARASDVAKDFAAFVAAHGPEVQQSLRANGIVPEKQVGSGQSAVGREESRGQRAESGGERAEGGGQKAAGLGPVALGQFDEEESGGEKAEPAALTPGLSPASGRGEEEAGESAGHPPVAARKGDQADRAASATSRQPGANTAQTAASAPSEAQASAGNAQLAWAVVLFAAAGAIGLVILRLTWRSP